MGGGKQQNWAFCDVADGGIMDRGHGSMLASAMPSELFEQSESKRLVTGLVPARLGSKNARGNPIIVIPSLSRRKDAIQQLSSSAN
ncbi:hypothetical protein ACTXT7_014162 [Hymenolepis weldensis]